MKNIALPLLILLTTGNIAQAADIKNGEKEFNINCAACHQIDLATVGPSLIEIRKKYPEEKLEYFLGWANEPGKVNKKMMQMPPMSHVGNKGLTDIHSYILEIAKGKTEKGKQKNVPSGYKKPKAVYPYVSRIFMGDSSPATIAIAFKPDLTLAWDTVIGGIRYAHIGSKASFAEHRPPSSPKESALKYRPTSAHPFSFGNAETYQYIGYKLEDNLPEILYQYGDVKVSEKLRLGKSPYSFTQHFNISGLKEAITLDLSHDGTVNITSSKGRIKNNILTINALDAQDFVIEVTAK